MAKGDKRFYRYAFSSGLTLSSPGNAGKKRPSSIRGHIDVASLHKSFINASNTFLISPNALKPALPSDDIKTVIKAKKQPPQSIRS